MLVLARAKINMSLEVLGRRPDGYHEVVTVLHTIGLADRLTFEPSDSLVLHCDVLGLSNERTLRGRRPSYSSARRQPLPRV